MPFQTSRHNPESRRQQSETAVGARWNRECWLDRRSFLRLAGIGTLVTLGGQRPILAASLSDPAFDRIIPADKKLSPDWIKALFERGVPEVFRKDQLRTIAMPISGICAGQELNLSGEGTLTGWRVHHCALDIVQGFVLRTTAGGKTATHLLGGRDFPDLTFRGEYPIAKVEYVNGRIPVEISLEAFSPFIPLNLDDSGLPATIFNFTLRNTSAAAVEATLAGSWENGICAYSRFNICGTRHNRIVQQAKMTVMNCDASPAPVDASRPDIIFEDWSKETFEGWTVEGTAFGPGPTERAKMEQQFGKLGGRSPRMANSFLPTQSDAATGKLTSAPFTIQRRYINFWLGGGSVKDKICVKLIVDGRPVQSLTGRNENRLAVYCFDVSKLEGRQAALQIIDASTDHDGRITVDRIFFSDVSGDGTPLNQLPDYGTMALALLGDPADVAIAKGSIGFDGEASREAAAPLAEPLIGTLGRTVQLKPGESAQVTFILAGYFPNLELRQLGKVGRYYATQFASAQAVVEYVAAHLDKLTGATRLWRDTWYDSTLPYWFLDRTFANASTLASGVCHRTASGRFYAYEGAPAPNYEGTCTHVWQYAHSAARTFPQLERDTRERVDLGVAFHPDSGIIGFRGDNGLAVDGQAGTILRFYREHQMSPDSSFLRRNWDKIKTTYKPLFALDADEDGILEGNQNNTLDCAWYGQIAWMSSLYLAAVRAGEQMAQEMGDDAFARRCRKIADNGFRNLPARLFNGEYFFNIIDPKQAEWVNSGGGSHIDQVYGQSWAFQVGLPRVLPEKETRMALRSLWRYNFSPDAGAYVESQKLPGRRFVSRGEAGMLMCTFPRTDWDYAKAAGTHPYGREFAPYFNETWTGQEYQVASHMFWEGMLQEGMAVVRAIHDRYNPNKRNPWAEEEAGIHYSRAMASHGTFLAICGFEYHGPRGHMGFAPRLTPERFRAPFVAAEGWGTYAQTISENKMQASLDVKWGKLKLNSLCLTIGGAGNTPSRKPISVKAALAGTDVPVTWTLENRRVRLAFTRGVTIPNGETLSIEIS